MRRKKLIDALDRAFFPDVTCLLCGAELREPDGRRLCASCRAGLTAIEKNPLEIDSLTAYVAYRYEGLARSIVLDEKDGDKPYLTSIVADALAEVLQKGNVGYDAIAYVPSSRKKRRTRGYDPMKLVARFLSERTGKPILPGLKRVREKRDQTKVAAKDRFENVQNDFVYDGEDPTGKTILLIDDVITTGATMKACAVALFEKSTPRLRFASFTAPVLEKKKSQSE